MMHPFITIKEIRHLLEQKKISVQEVLEFYTLRFQAYDDIIKSTLELFDHESVLNFSGKSGKLHGVPGLIKDNICQSNRKLTCASKILKGFTSPYDATASSLLKKQGALLVGRANCDEFAMGSSNEYSAYAKTVNPWDKTRVPGGSSGGSAAAVSAGLVPFALGSETGGSVRLPAAFCGIVGMKPTYGLVSRYGLVAYGSSLDQISPFSQNVYDNALVLSTIAGHDKQDGTSLPNTVPDYTNQLDGKIPENLTIGVVENALFVEGMDPEIRQAIEQAIKQFEKLGAKIKYISLPSLEYSAATYFIISRAEAASNLARFDGVRYGFRKSDVKNIQQLYAQTRDEGFGEEVKARILIGNYVLSAGYAAQFYDSAQKVRKMIAYEFNQMFKDVDTLLMPVHSIPAFKFGEFESDKLAMDLQDLLTCPINLSGIPALALPCGMTKNNLPIGMQLVGPHHAESLLYKVGYAYEQSTQWHTMRPNLDNLFN